MSAYRASSAAVGFVCSASMALSFGGPGGAGARFPATEILPRVRAPRHPTSGNAAEYNRWTTDTPRSRVPSSLWLTPHAAAVCAAYDGTAGGERADTGTAAGRSTPR